MTRALKLLRDIQTKEWLTVRGTFSKTFADAVEVETFRDAERLRQEHKGRRLEMVIRFPNGAPDVYLPLE